MKISKKSLRLAILAAGLSLLTVDAGWAMTAYVVGLGQDDLGHFAFAVDPSTIAEASAGHRIADVYDISSTNLFDIVRTDFDCAAHQAQTLSDKVYQANENGVDFVVDHGGAAAPEPIGADTTLGSLVHTFVCGWPQVSSGATKVEPDPPNLQTLVDTVGRVLDELDDEQDEAAPPPQ